MKFGVWISSSLLALAAVACLGVYAVAQDTDPEKAGTSPAEKRKADPNDEPAQKPVFDGLERKEYEVVFKLVDAKDKPVIADRDMGYDTVWLTRKYHDWSWRVAAEQNADMILASLPPGKYELRARIGHYGDIAHDFIVTDADISETLKLPNWRRVVEIVFEDQDGKKVDYLYRAPRYRAKNRQDFDYPEYKRPKSRLRLPLEALSNSGVSFGRGGSGSGSANNLLTKTDDGSIWTVMFAGVESDVRYDDCFLSEEVVAVPDEYDTTFVNIPGDKVIVTVDFKDTEREDPRNAELGLLNADDPGFASKKEVPPPHKYWKNKSDRKKLQKKWPPIQIDFTNTQSLAFTSFRGGAFQTYVVYREKNRLWAAIDRKKNPTIPMHCSTDSYYERGRVRVEPKNKQSGYGLTKYRGFGGHHLDVSVPTDPDAEPTKIPGVCFRVVGPDGQGIPVTEAVFMPLDDNELTATVFEAEKARAKKKDRPKLTDDQTEWLLGVDDTYSDDELREVLDDVHDGLYDALKTREARLYFCKHGTWYDPWTQMRGDTDGYFIAPDQKMEKGKKYALYVWTKSTDDLEPDYQFVFEGQGETTDLGCITLKDD